MADVVNDADVMAADMAADDETDADVEGDDDGEEEAGAAAAVRVGVLMAGKAMGLHVTCSIR